jgi:acetyl esterase
MTGNDSPTIETHPVPSEQARAYVAAEASKRPFWECGAAEARRERREEALATGGDPEPVAGVEEVSAAGVPARLYRPVGGEARILVWLHGGAWVVGDLDTEDALARALANRGECAVLSVDYRLAPEHRYPAALEDSWAATQWAAERFDSVAVGGDSAGGNLSAVVALRARDRGVKLALQLLVYPMLDYRVDSPAYDRYRDEYRVFAGIQGFGAGRQDGIGRVWDVYLTEPPQRSHPEVSPMRARSFEGVAPALIITAEHDILRNEAEEYARRLETARVQVELVDYAGQVHGFYHWLGVMDDARDAVERSAARLRSAFSRAGDGRR